MRLADANHRIAILKARINELYDNFTEFNADASNLAIDELFEEIKAIHVAMGE